MAVYDAIDGGNRHVAGLELVHPACAIDSTWPREICQHIRAKFHSLLRHRRIEHLVLDGDAY